MTVHDLQELFDYGHWANAKLFAAVERLTHDQFIRPISGSHGSIRNIMVHLLSAEWGWLARCGGPVRGPALDPAAFQSVDSVVALWRTVEGHTRRFVGGLHEEDLARDVEFAFPGVGRHALPVSEILQHAAAHGVHHRGQVSLLLRLHGLSPDDFDMLFFRIDRRQPSSRYAHGREGGGDGRAD